MPDDTFKLAKIHNEHKVYNYYASWCNFTFSMLFSCPPPEGQLTSLTKCVVRTFLLIVYILLDVKKVHPRSHKLHRHSILSLYINSDALNEQ
jgi:hypothetical protein